MRRGLTYCVSHSIVRRMAQGDSPALALELRRGVIVLATLSQLRLPRYGYELRQALAEYGMPIEEGTLYPLLRRLETQGVLRSEWRTNEGAPRRYYMLSAEGRRLFKRLTETWYGLNEAMDRLLASGGLDGR
jgi:PadR family transcriptional regulator PadR